MTGTFDDYLYVMRLYIYSSVSYVDYYSLFPIVLERLLLRFLILMSNVESMSLVPQGMGLGDEYGVSY
jgi:hypothetical protein